MDTHLIDSCREARGELERNYSTETNQMDQKKVCNDARHIFKSSMFSPGIFFISFQITR